MNTKYKLLALGGLLGLVVIIIITWVFLKTSQTGPQTSDGSNTQEVSTDDPIDIVLDFYDLWLEAVQSTSTNPFQLELATRPILSKSLSDKLKENQTGLDPVLCQSVIPQQITARSIFKQQDKTQVLVMAKDKTVTEQAIVTLKQQNGGWYIDDIMCSPGEFAPTREFSFEKEGSLLKSVPLPLDPQYWHIVFEENGELGHAVPLFFDEESRCLSIELVEATCIPDQFTETKKVYVYGQMTELGVEVKRLEFRE